MYESSLKIDIEATVSITLNNKTVVFSISPKEKSFIYKEQLLNINDMPEDFSEITWFKRIDDSNEIASIKEVLLVGHTIIPQMFLLSLGKPLLWVCQKNLALLAEKIYSKKYKFEILRGSLKEYNSYESIDDEQIIKLSCLNDK